MRLPPPESGVKHLEAPSYMGRAHGDDSQKACHVLHLEGHTRLETDLRRVYSNTLDGIPELIPWSQYTRGLSHEKFPDGGHPDKKVH